MFLTKDPVGEGDLKMDQIREAYADYCGRFVERDEIDAILSGCTVQVNKRGLVKYSQFIQVRSRRLLEVSKKKIRQAF
jgi:Ca2+-binding EF-hand superfamily protein